MDLFSVMPQILPTLLSGITALPPCHPFLLQHAVPEKLSNQSINTIRTAWFQRCPTYVMQKKGVQGLLNLKLMSATPHVTQFLLQAGLHVLCLSFWTITIVHSCIIINSYWKDILENVALCNHI